MNSVSKSRLFKALTFVWFVFVVRASAQNPDLFFEVKFPYHTLGNPPVSIFADKPTCYVTEVAPDGKTEGYCLMTINHDRSCFNYETQSVSRPLVYKVSQQGELLGTLALGCDDRYAFVHGLYQAHDDPQVFLAVGRLHDNELHYDRPFVARFDNDLNLLWQREIELPEAYRNYISFGTVMDSDGNIFCSSYFFDCGGGNAVSRFCFRLTPEGELAGIADIPLQSEFQKVFEFTDGSGDYGLLENIIVSESVNKVMLLRMNRNLELVGQQELPDRYVEMDPTNTYPSLSFILFPAHISTSGRHAMALLPDGSMILANEASVACQDIYQGIHDLYYGIGFLQVSSGGEAVSCMLDGEMYLTADDSLMMILPVLPAGDDSFYFIYLMGDRFWAYDYMNCFVVGRMDFNGNLLWRRYWNRYFPEYDMKIYYPQDAVITHDDGCLISGFSFNSNINSNGNYTYEPDVFLLKFFADGTLSVPQEKIVVRPYAFWPNPAGDWLKLEYSPDVKPEFVEIFDLQGKKVVSQRNNLESIRTAELPSGVYSIRVTLEGGQSYTDKIVKQ